ncbi:hypothetical protein HAPG_00033 [Halorubrum phage GNf2]|nr:hypothetical protein HAPG_00033 [Halorubrum phage GNf2]
MVEDELEPAKVGHVDAVSDTQRDVRSFPIVARMMDDIQRHGEVHATFEHVDGEVECRLGTTKMNFVAGVIEVFDGDQYQPFAMESLVTWEVPMDLFH